MNARPHRDSAATPWLCRAYATALLLYPRAHRERWGAEMRSAFRDRCRQLRGQQLYGWLLAVALPDLVASTTREGVADLIGILQGVPVRKSLLITSGILQVIGTGLMVVSAISLWYGVHSGRFSHPGAFDALAALQLALGLGGTVLLAIGIRELVSISSRRMA